MVTDYLHQEYSLFLSEKSLERFKQIKIFFDDESHFYWHFLTNGRQNMSQCLNYCPLSVKASENIRRYQPKAEEKTGLFGNLPQLLVQGQHSADGDLPPNRAPSAVRCPSEAALVWPGTGAHSAKYLIWLLPP